MRGVIRLVLLMAITLGVAAGQSAPAQKPQGSEVPTFQTKAELVLVPVVVTDKKGEHIHGLSKEDFAIVEDDRNKVITAFDSVHTEPRVVQLASAEDVFTNTVKPTATQARVTIIVLDTLNTTFFDQVTARREILKFLSNLEPGEPVALLNLSKSGLHVIHDFSSDPQILAAAVKHVRGQLGFKDTSSGDQVSDNLPALPAVVSESAALQNIETEVEGAFASQQQSYAIKVTLESMRQIAKAFTGFEG